MVLYEGPSTLNQQNIVVIATGIKNPSNNVKTGKMIQTYILVADQHPLEAIKTENDAAICGDCPARGTWCYASIGHSGMGLGAIYRSYQAGKYPAADYAVFTDRYVRLGAYGDPAAAPLAIWDALLSNAAGWTGYTHQWRDCPAGFQRYCMASVDSLEEQEAAQMLGWRTYRVTSNPELRNDKEVICPHYTTGIQCVDCGYCNGTVNARRGSIVAQAHGTRQLNFVEWEGRKTAPGPRT